MNQTKPITQLPNETAVVPVYPFNAPGESVLLHDGPIGGFAGSDWPGTIELCCLPRLGVNWKIEHEDYASLNLVGPTSLRLKHRGVDRVVEAHRGSYTVTGDKGPVSTGWIGTAVLGKSDARLARVLVHWMNLPHIDGPIGLVDVAGHSFRSRGRWRTEVEGWSLTLDVRPDYVDAMKRADTTHLYVLTHVMEIRRTDGSSFDPAAVEKLIECLRVSFSFAFGRWVAPVLPVGYDAADQIVWEVWTSPICDPAQSIGHVWLPKTHTDDLAELLRCTVPMFDAQGEGGITRFQMILAIQAVEAGFVEQRILAAAPALENLAWANLHLDKGRSERWYADCFAEDKLRFVLEEAGIPTDIDAANLPALAAYAQRDNIDGPTAVTRVRNRLVHPKDPQDQIYRHEGLVRDAWLLSLNYVTLLILHSIGYRGSYGDLSHLTRWAGETNPVPWAVTGGTPQPAPLLPLSKSEIRRAQRGPRGNRRQSS